MFQNVVGCFQIRQTDFDSMDFDLRDFCCYGESVGPNRLSYYLRKQRPNRCYYFQNCCCLDYFRNCLSYYCRLAIRYYFHGYSQYYYFRCHCHFGVHFGGRYLEVVLGLEEVRLRRSLRSCCYFLVGYLDFGYLSHGTLGAEFRSRCN